MSGNLKETIGGELLALDGGFGTELMAAGLRPGACGELWNVDDPKRIVEIHRAYVDAGADAILTNSFGASAVALARHGLAERAAELNRAAAERAREAAGDRAWVLGDLGPSGDFLEPLGDLSADAARSAFAEQAAALRAGGADGFIVETMADPNELAAAVAGAREAGGPVLASYAFDAGAGTFRTMMGTDVAEAVRAAIEAGADAVGANCGTSLGLEDYERLVRELVAAAGSTPVLLEANAGAPRLAEGREVFPVGPEEMGAAAERFLDAGVRVLGGCCGTRPEHVRAIAEAVHRHRESHGP